MSRRAAAELYSAPESTLRDRMTGRPSRLQTRPNYHKVTKIEEVIIRYILDMDTRGFAPRLAGVEDMANYILETRGAQRVGSSWSIALYNAIQNLRRVLIMFTTSKGPCAKILSLLEHGSGKYTI